MCIYNSYLTGRGEQVRVMGDVYQKALKAVVWLNEEEGDIDCDREVGLPCYLLQAFDDCGETDAAANVANVNGFPDLAL
jgi:hypothetical protein